MNQRKNDMLNSILEDLNILDERYNYAHSGVSACIEILDNGIPKLENKQEMIAYIIENRPEYMAIDTAIPMQYWKDCDTQLSGYAYFKDGTERLISLPEVIAYIQGGIKV